MLKWNLIHCCAHYKIMVIHVYYFFFLEWSILSSSSFDSKLSVMCVIYAVTSIAKQLVAMDADRLLKMVIKSLMQYIEMSKIVCIRSKHCQIPLKIYISTTSATIFILSLSFLFWELQWKSKTTITTYNWQSP